MPTTTPPRRDDEISEDDDGLGAPVEVPAGGFRHHMRTKPGVRHVYRAAIFGLGLVCIAGGVAMAVLPGPLTIPPVLLGLWIWSTEFAFAERLFDQFKEKGHEAWDHAKKHPVSSTIVTVAGLIMAVVAIWAVTKYDLIDKARDAVGL